MISFGQESHSSSFFSFVMSIPGQKPLLWSFNGICPKSPCNQSLPAICIILSTLLRYELPPLRFVYRGPHCSNSLVHSSAGCLTIRPAHFHFNRAVHSSFFELTTSFRIFSRNDIHSFFLSMELCVILCLLALCLVTPTISSHKLQQANHLYYRISVLDWLLVFCPSKILKFPKSTHIFLNPFNDISIDLFLY